MKTKEERIEELFEEYEKKKNSLWEKYWKKIKEIQNEERN